MNRPQPVRRAFLGSRRPMLMLLYLLLLQTTFVPHAHAIIDCWIDPGHGNKDAGAQGIDGPGRPNEADITFHLCQTWLQAWLGGYGYDVALIRNSEGSKLIQASSVPADAHPERRSDE